jgi:hypothetical protein
VSATRIENKLKLTKSQWLTGAYRGVRTLINTLRFTSHVFKQSKIHDCLFVIIIASLSMSQYIVNLGFYSDDWALLYSMHLSPDQSFAEVFTAVNFQDNEIRPIQFLGYAVSYKLFGLNPLGYHLLNGIFFMTAFVLLYIILIALCQPRVLAISIPVIYMLLPNYSTDRFWMAVHAATISMLFTFLGIYAHLQALRGRKAGVWGWEAFAILCVIASGLTYEVFLPLVLVTAVFLFASELAKEWPVTVGRRTIAKAALRQAGMVMAVISLIVVKGLWAPRTHWITDIGTIPYIYWTIKAVLKSFIYSYGYHLLGLPVTVWSALRDYPDWITVTTAGVIGSLIFVRLYTLWDQSDAAAVRSRAKMLIYFGCGVVVFIAAYSIVPIVPVKNGINNRTAIAGTLGAAVSIVGLLGILTALAPGIWQKALFSAVLGVIGMSGSLTVDTLAKFWIESYRLQSEYLFDIRSHVPAIPAGTTLILDGVCPYNGPAPVFEAPWDLSSALGIHYGLSDIKANIVTRWTRVEPGGLVTPFCCGEIRYPFDHLVMYHFGRKMSYPLPNAQAAQSYFSKISTDRESRCPVDFYGNGVEVLGGFIPMFGQKSGALQ